MALPSHTMNFSPSKRRKISPNSAVRVNRHDVQRRSESQDGHLCSIRTASFMSPTKASLARFNPKLLPPSTLFSPHRRGSSISHDVFGLGDTLARLRKIHSRSREPNRRARVTTTKGIAANASYWMATIEESDMDGAHTSACIWSRTLCTL